MGHAVHGPGAERCVGDAAREHADPDRLEQPGVGPFLGPVDESQNDDLRAAASGVLRQVRADEAGAAGHEQLHPNAAASAVAMRSLARPSP